MGSGKARRSGVRGSLAVPLSPSISSSAAEVCDRVLLRRGATIPFEELPERSIALDGYVQGPRMDPVGQRYSFDHHAGCIRHATLATCEMALDAVRVGLDPAGMLLCLNDLDTDSVVSTWILLRPAAAFDHGVVAAIRSLGRLDALGPAEGGPGLFPALRWALQPLLDAAMGGQDRRLDEAGYRGLLDACLERLDRWWLAGALADDERFLAPPTTPDPPLEQLHRGAGWVLARTQAGSSAFPTLYRSGIRAAVVARPLHDGTTEYSVGKASEFVASFDVPHLLTALAKAEQARNPQQDPARTWGGGSTIGGSPRNADGSSSRLAWQEVVTVVEGVVGQEGKRP